MASGSKSRQSKAFHAHPLLKKLPNRPNISNPPSLGSDSPLGLGSTPARASSSTCLRPKQSTTDGLLQVELARLKYVLTKEEARLSGVPQVQSVVGGLEKCLDYLLIKEQNQHEYKKHISDLANLAPLLWKPFIESNPRIMSQEVREVTVIIKNKLEVIKNPGRSLKPNQPVRDEDKGDLVSNCFREVREQLGELKKAMGTWEERREWWTVCACALTRIQLKKFPVGQDARLKDLLPTHQAYYNAALPTTVAKRVGCTKDTRINLLNDTQNWTRDKDGAKIFWLNGMAGTGKTTIAYTMCKWLQQDGRLAASFFCSRNSLECRDVNRIVPTIAYQLGQRGRYPDSYRHTLCTTFEEDIDVAKRDISTQFKSLIAGPLSAIGKTMANNMVVVIDALDECTDVHGTEVVLNMLLQHAERLPIKFFVTSRPEPAIIQRMMTGDGGTRSILWLHDIDKSLVQADIRTYLAEALRSAQVTTSELDALAERAGCLFIFAATAVRYILPKQGSVDHRKRLLTLLNLRPTQRHMSHKDIDDLYANILSDALNGEIFEEDELIARQRVLWTIICARNPLTVSAIAELLNIADIQSVEVAVQPLQSVLYISESNVVSTLHASFPDFLLDKARAGRFHCDETIQGSCLVECCFQLMARSLRFNLCGLKSSYAFDQDVHDLKHRVKKAISFGLFYSCSYWGDHITKCLPSSRLIPLLNSFMQQHFLFWMEVLNLKRAISRGDHILDQVLAWLPTDNSLIDLRGFIRDARDFLISFASHPTSLSTPHIYISALPFTPKTSRVWTTYWPLMRGLICVYSGPTEARRRSALATWVAGQPVSSIARSSDGKRITSSADLENWHLERGAESMRDASSGTHMAGPLKKKHLERLLSVAFSPDDSRIASGSADRTIRIWDTNSCRLLCGPLRGHTGHVNSVSFSLDGTCLASGSSDHTIRVWDANSGNELGEPLRGHQSSVMSVSFSPDGNHLASGSSDCSVRVWDSRTWISIRRPFEGHTQPVNSIAYSPNALRLVSGSDDGTIGVWDAASGRLLARSTSSYFGDAVLSVSFSPNGTLVVSGSRCQMVHVWGAEDGTLLAGPFEGHSGRVSSVLFSVDGARVLSGSADGTIRLWDAHHRPRGTTKPLGHTGGINCVAVSPDGARVASGSKDSTICIWDTSNGTLLTNPLRGHTAAVSSVAFSPDGGRIVSGSWDGTVHTWDASTGTLLASPSKGHADVVLAVSFSSDGNRVASCSDGGTIQIWNLQTGLPHTNPFNGGLEGAASIAFSPDGARLASGSYDLTVRMWCSNRDASTSPLWTSCTHTGAVSCVAFSPDGTRVVSGSWDCTILVLDTNSGTVSCGPFNGHTSHVLSVAFSPDGTHIVSGSDDRTVRLWDAHSGTMVNGPLGGHSGAVESVVFSPDGGRVISGSADCTVRFWDIAVLTEAGPASSHSLFVSSDGWLTNSNSQPLLWVPSDLRNVFTLRSLSNRIIISNEYSISLDNPTLCLGDEWHKCYCLASPPTA